MAAKSVFGLKCNFCHHTHTYPRKMFALDTPFTCPTCGAVTIIADRFGDEDLEIDPVECNCHLFDLDEASDFDRLASHHQDIFLGLLPECGQLPHENQPSISVSLDCPYFVITAWDKHELLGVDVVSNILHMSLEKTEKLLKTDRFLKACCLNANYKLNCTDSELKVPRAPLYIYTELQIQNDSLPSQVSVYTLPEHTDWKVLVYNEDANDVFGGLTYDDEGDNVRFLLFASDENTEYPLIILDINSENEVESVTPLPFHINVNRDRKEILINPLFDQKFLRLSLHFIASSMGGILDEFVNGDGDENEEITTGTNLPVIAAGILNEHPGSFTFPLWERPDNYDDPDAPPSMRHPLWN